MICIFNSLICSFVMMLSKMLCCSRSLSLSIVPPIGAKLAFYLRGVPKLLLIGVAQLLPIGVRIFYGVPVKIAKLIDCFGIYIIFGDFIERFAWMFGVWLLSTLKSNVLWYEVPDLLFIWNFVEWSNFLKPPLSFGIWGHCSNWDLGRF